MEDDSGPLNTGYQTLLRNNFIHNNPAFGIDNQAPDKHQFISENNTLFGNLAGPYRNAQSSTDTHAKPAIADTLEQVYYAIMHPIWEAAEAQDDYRSGLSTAAAWARYRQ